MTARRAAVSAPVVGLLFAACAPVPAATPVATPVATLAVPSPVALAIPTHEPATEAAAAAEPAPDHEMTAQEAAENPALRAAVQQLDEWATSALQVAWTSSSRTEEACFDAHDEAIACTGAARHREKRRKISKQATLTNSGALPLECWPVVVVDIDSSDYARTRLAPGQTTTPLQPGQSVVLPKVEPSEGQLMLDQPAVICSIPTAALSQSLGVDLSPVTGRASGSLLVIASGDSYQFTAGDSRAPGVFEWFERGVLLK